jgi:hypothetical protein
MIRNASYKYLNSINTPKYICNLIITYIPNYEYNNVVREFTVLIHYYNWGFSSERLYRVIPIILKQIRKEKIYKMSL